MSAFSWEEEMLSNVDVICKDGVRQWAQLIETLGVPTNFRIEWCATYLKELRQLMVEMYTDLEERQKNITKNIADLRNKINECAFHLGTTVEYSCEPNLYQQEAKMKLDLDALQTQVKSREVEIGHILERQRKICNVLGKPTRILQNKPLPTNEELDVFIQYVETLEDDCFLREERFTTTQCELQALAEAIDYEPANSFEEQVLRNEDKSTFAVHDKNMILLTSFEQSLKQHANNIRQEVDIFMATIKSLWNTLDTDEKYRQAFTEANSGMRKATIVALKNEIKRLEDLKRANLHTLIKRLREQLVIQWDLCHFSEHQRELFDIFNDEMYTESMLTLFQNEVAKVQKMYTDNQSLYESLAKFETTWKRVDELETPEQGQNRFRNRGGKLLIEEKERKLAKKRLEKLQQSIMKMADSFFANYGDEFTYDGLTVEEYFRSFAAKDELRVTNSKVTMASKSANVISRSAQKLPRLTASSSSYQSGKARLSPKRSESPSHKSTKSVSKVTDKSKSVPTKRYKPITSGADKLQRNPVKLKARSKLIRQLHQDCNLEEIANIHDYKYFQKIMDTTMPTLLNNTLDVAGNSSKSTTNQDECGSPLAYPLPPTIIENDENSSPNTPRASLQNVTMRRLHRHRSDPNLSTSFF